MLGTLPLSDIRGPRDTLETNLSGKDGPAWLDALNKFNRKENPWPVRPQFPFSVWRTITLGCPSKSYLKGYVNQWVRQFLLTTRADKIINYSQKAWKVDLVTVSVGELGFEEARRNVILARGVEMGLALCFPEDALALALSLVELDAVMAMDAIVPDGPRLFGFSEGELVFIKEAAPFVVWPRQTVFIFRKPRR